MAYGERDMANLLRGACTPAWTAGRRERSRHTRAIRPHTALHTLCRRKTKLVLLPGAFGAPPCSIGWPPWDTWTWATCIFESRTFVPSTLPSWIRHWGGCPVSAWERVGVMVSYLDMLNHEDGTAQPPWNLSGKRT